VPTVICWIGRIGFAECLKAANVPVYMAKMKGWLPRARSHSTWGHEQFSARVWCARISKSRIVCFFDRPMFLKIGTVTVFSRGALRGRRNALDRWASNADELFRAGNVIVSTSAGSNQVSKNCPADST